MSPQRSLRWALLALPILAAAAPSPVVGVHDVQVVRANRSHPPDQNHREYTCNHQPTTVSPIE